MKRLGYLFSMIIVLFIFCSCGGNPHRNNYFIEGIFSGTNFYNESQVFYLEVKEISKDEYKNANGVNVIKDDVLKDKYFSLSIYYFYIEIADQRNYITFSNVKVRGEKAMYDDKVNGITIVPSTTDNSFHHSEPPYRLEISDNNINNYPHAFVYLDKIHALDD